MKGQRNKRRVQAEARTNRRALWQLALGLGAGALLLGVMLLPFPSASPRLMVQAQIVRGEKIAPAKPQTSHATPAPASPVSPSNTVVVSVTHTLPAQPSPAGVPASREKYLRVSFARLSSFQFKVTDEIADANADPTTASERTHAQFPNTVKILSEKQVAITGFMLPLKVANGLATDFLLLKNQSACCYGVMPRINEWVVVRTAGKGVKPIKDVPVTVQGTLHVGEIREEGHLTGIYRLDCDRLLQGDEQF